MKRICAISHVGGAIIYIPTKFREHTLIWSRDMPQNEIPYGPPGGRIFLPVSIFDKCHPSGTFYVSSSKISRKSLNARLRCCDSSFNLCIYLKPTLPTAQRHSAVMQAIYWLIKKSRSSRSCRSEWQWKSCIRQNTSIFLFASITHTQFLFSA